jgi:hypothetical protein
MKKLLLKITKFYTNNLNFAHDLRLFIHSNRKPFFALKEKLYFGQEIKSIDEVIELRKTSYKELEWPYSECNTYSHFSSFNSISTEDCLRKCVLHYFKERFNCFYWNFSNIITEFDDKKLENCNQSVIDIIIETNKTFESKCYDLCPKDCIEEEYELVKRTQFRDTESSFIDYTFSDKTLDIEWDDSQPIITYLNEPLLTLYDLICTFGGILGIYFGLSVYQIISYTTEFTQKVFGKIRLI